MKPSLASAALAVLSLFALGPLACSRGDAHPAAVAAAAPGDAVLPAPAPADLPPPAPRAEPSPPPSPEEIAAFHAPVPK